MSQVDITRAWRDAKYRRSLTPEQRKQLPENPAGITELSDEDIKVASGLAGGAKPIATTAITCTMFTFLKWAACGCGPVTTAITCTQHTFAGWRACCK